MYYWSFPSIEEFIDCFCHDCVTQSNLWYDVIMSSVDAYGLSSFWCDNNNSFSLLPSIF